VGAVVWDKVERGNGAVEKERNMNTTQNSTQNQRGNSELKPCPFCGGKGKLRDLTGNLYGFNGYEIKCACGCYLKSHLCGEPQWDGNKYYTPVTERGKAKALEDLIILWNRRATDEN
jgi:Lar family restriction alleviation protein